VSIAITSHPEGVTIALKVQPKAKRNALVGGQAGALKVSVTAPPEDGKANEAVIELLRCTFKLPRSQLEILSGHTNRNKVLLVRGVTVEQLTALLPSV
jgi:uncharacterized protein (TIGR00251 family)